MLNRIRQNIHQWFTYRGVRTEDDLYSKYPALCIVPDQYKKNYSLLKPFHEHYVQHISSAGMAVSLELAASLLSYCELTKPQHIIDLGSGFSSFVFRYFKKTHPEVTVYSVDDDADWLKQTISYLGENELDTSHVYSLKEFKSLEESTKPFFNLLFLDLNYVEVRVNYLVETLTMAAPGSLIFLDDVHKTDYFTKASLLLKSKQLPFWILRNTTDTFKRFCLLVLNK